MMADAEPLVALHDVVVRAGGNVVLENVSLTVRAGEIVTLIGPNGSGKSTLVRVALGLIRPEGGTVQRIAGLTIGYVPQHLSVDPNLPLTVGRFLTLGQPVHRDRVAAALRTAGVPGLINSPLHSVSGGEARRALLARALLREPRLLVLDEPAAGMDVNGQSDLYRLIRTLRSQRRCGVLLVSHDLHLVMAATDHVVCLNRHVCCAGKPDEVSRHPEYLNLFGADLASQLAVYTHAHDHQHAADGKVAGSGTSDG